MILRPEISFFCSDVNLNAWQPFNRRFFRKLVHTFIQNIIFKRNLLHTSHITCQTVVFLAPCVVLQEFLFDLTSSPVTWYYGLTISSSSYPLLHFGLPCCPIYSSVTTLVARVEVCSIQLERLSLVSILRGDDNIILRRSLRNLHAWVLA